MLIQCGNCGAPLDVDEGRTVVKCVYCRSSNRVAGTKTISAQTPVGWKPPTTWTPPDDAQAPSKPLPYKKGASTALIVAAIATFVVGLTVFALVASENTAGVPDVSRVAVAELATLELDLPRARFGERFPTASVDESTATLALESDAFDSVYVRWDEAGERIASMTFLPLEGRSGDPWVERFRPHLGHRIDTTPDGYAMASYPGSASLMIRDDGEVSFGAAPEDGTTVDDVAYGRALWSVVRVVALGHARAIDAPTRELLAGYTLARIAEVETSVVVDDALASVQRVLPGAAATRMTSLDIEVHTDHPWFGSVSMSWANAAGGRLESFSVWHPVGTDALQDPDAIARCLAPILGEPQITEADHLAGTRNFTWTPSSHWVDGVWMITNNIHFRMGGDDAPERFRRMLRTLDACGR